MNTVREHRAAPLRRRDGITPQLVCVPGDESRFVTGRVVPVDGGGTI